MITKAEWLAAYVQLRTHGWTEHQAKAEVQRIVFELDWPLNKDGTNYDYEGTSDWYGSLDTPTP